jgi:hypothetical protein
VITSVDADGKESGPSTWIAIENSEGSLGPSSNNWQAGDYVAVWWAAVEGATEYRVYKSQFGSVPGYVGTAGPTAVPSWNDYNNTPSVTEGYAEYINPFDQEADRGYPSAVCLFEQRLVFASTPGRPSTVWMSKSGDYSNFAEYALITDDSPITLTLASPEVTPALWMVPLRSLVLGTSGMEWELSSTGESAFTAKTAQAKPQSYWGSSLKKVIMVGNALLHVSSSGAQVRNLQYQFTEDSYGGADLSILASHLFETPEQRIIDWAYEKNPDSIIWCVKADGTLAALTYQQEHQVLAWSRHDTDGRVFSVAAIPFGRGYSLFLGVERQVNGVRYFNLEVLAERYISGDETRFMWADASLTYDEPKRDAVQTISGLEYLEGKEVCILNNGAVEPMKRVQSGKITLDTPTRLVTIGLPYTAELETMPIEIVGGSGTSVALKKQIPTVNITFRNSRGAEVGLTKEPGDLSGVKWQLVKWRTNEPLGTPPRVFSGIKHLMMPSLAENSQSVGLRSTDPTPLTVQSIVARIEVKTS